MFNRFKGLIILFLLVCFNSPASSSSNTTIITASKVNCALVLESFGEVERAEEVIASLPRDAAGIARVHARLLAKMGLYERADSAYSLACAQMNGKSLTERQLQCFIHAVYSLNAGDGKKALRYLELLDSHSIPTLEDYIIFARMKAKALQGDYEKAVELGITKINDGLCRTLTPEFEGEVLKCLSAANNDSLALVVISSLKKILKKDKKIIPFLLQEINLSITGSNHNRARKAAMELIQEYPRSDAATEAIEILLSNYPLSDLKTDELIQYCKILVDHKKKITAKKFISELGKRSLKETEREHKNLYEGILLYHYGRYEKALKILKYEFQKQEIFSKSLIWKARAYRKLKRYRLAAETYEYFSRYYPKNPTAPEALLVAAHLWEKNGHHSRSRSIRTALADKYPDSYYGVSAALENAFYFIERRQYRKGAEILKNASELSGRSFEEYFYYMARCYEYSGEKHLSSKAAGRLNKINRCSFYIEPEIKSGFKAPALSSRGRAIMDGEHGLIKILSGIEHDRNRAYAYIDSLVRITGQREKSWKNNKHFELGRLFLQSGLIVWAENELGEAMKDFRSNPAALSALARIYDGAGMVWESLKTYERLKFILARRHRISVDDRFDIVLYPLPFPGMVLERCIRYNIPPNLAFALIREESRFHAKAVSRAGAVGLMQLMPETGLQLADELGYAVDESILVLPELNIELGMRYASRLLMLCKGRYHMMLAAYNAGMKNAKRWFTKKNMNWSLQWQVDHIDYKETRQYVKRIVESANRYSFLYDFSEE